MRTRKCLEYRNIRLSDDVKKVGELLYQTDPYIYPEFFGCVENAELIMKEAIEQELYCFHLENIFGAFDGDKLLGMVCMNPEGKYKWEEEEWCSLFRECGMLRQEVFHQVSHEYFKEMDNENFEDKIYILAICVLDGERGQGIGTEMLKRFLEQHPTGKMVLDTLADNEGAVALYEKCGFKTVDVYYGFSTTEEKPRCLRMER